MYWFSVDNGCNNSALFHVVRESTKASCFSRRSSTVKDVHVDRIEDVVKRRRCILFNDIKDVVNVAFPHVEKLWTSGGGVLF